MFKCNVEQFVGVVFYFGQVWEVEVMDVVQGFFDCDQFVDGDDGVVEIFVCQMNEWYGEQFVFFFDEDGDGVVVSFDVGNCFVVWIVDYWNGCFVFFGQDVGIENFFDCLVVIGVVGIQGVYLVGYFFDEIGFEDWISGVYGFFLVGMW